MTVHEFNFFKFLGLTVITVIAMGLVIFILFMIGILFQELGGFLSSVCKEALYR